MNPLEAHRLENGFQDLLTARSMALAALEDIRSCMRPGLLESEATKIAKNIFAEHGAEKHWHRPWVRFGKNTIYKFSEVSPADECLQENDIYFFDFGPVFNNIEADIGDTFITGNDPEHGKCQSAVHKIFEVVKNEWQQNKRSGRELYSFAQKKCEELGYEINLNVSGHRLSDFPHQIYSKARMDKIDFSPSPGLWILEFQIRHPQKSFGAFYEDLLW